MGIPLLDHIFNVAIFDLFWSWHENTQMMPITFHCLLSDLVSFCSILTIVDEFMKYQSHFLHSSLREAEGMCQHAATKVQVLLRWMGCLMDQSEQSR